MFNEQQSETDTWIMNITFTESQQVPVTIVMKNPEIKAKVLGVRNGITKLNIFFPFPKGATIGYTRTRSKVAPGGIDTFDQRFVHWEKSPSCQFPELHSEFHALTITQHANCNHTQETNSQKELHKQITNNETTHG